MKRIFYSRSPIKIFVKFSMKDYSVTCSLAYYAFGFFKFIGVFFGNPGDVSCNDWGVPYFPGLLAEEGSDFFLAEF